VAQFEPIPYTYTGVILHDFSREGDLACTRTIRRANVHIRLALILRKLRMALHVKERERKSENPN